MCKEYTYDLQIVFDGTEDGMYAMGFKSFYDNIEDVRADALSQISIHIYPVEEK